MTRVDAQLLSGSAIRFVGTATSGFDHIDRDYLARNNIGFAHAPGSNANSVVEYVLAAIAAIEDKLEQLMSGALVGIVGYGHIGKALAARLQALGIGFRVYDPWLDQGAIANAASLEAAAAWEIDVQAITDSAFEGDVEAAERAVGLFNAYWARCHTSGWSEGVLYTQEAEAGALGPALWHGRENVQFQNAEQLTAFLLGGSEPQKAYGVNGFGSGRMPAFGMILSQEDIDLLVTYLRNGDLSASEG